MFSKTNPLGFACVFMFDTNTRVEYLREIVSCVIAYIQLNLNIGLKQVNVFVSRMWQEKTECNFIILLCASIKVCLLFVSDIGACHAMSHSVACDPAVLCHNDVLKCLYEICIRRIVTSNCQCYHAQRRYAM